MLPHATGRAAQHAALLRQRTRVRVRRRPLMRRADGLQLAGRHLTCAGRAATADFRHLAR